MSSVATAPAQLVTLSAAVVLRGARAWARIKSTAAEQRQLWREVGEALRYGRALHKSNQAFGKWVKEHGFDDMSVNARTDAMWFAENFAACHNDCETTHPTAIRKAHREAQAVTPPTPELSLEGALNGLPAYTQFIEKVAPVAKTVNKLAAMAERGDGQEKATAQKYLDKKAKELGLPTEELVELGQKLDPQAGLPANLQPVLEENLKTLAEIVGELVDFVRSTHAGEQGDTPITKEFAIGLVVATFNRLEK